jgi:hypothetical protein
MASCFVTPTVFPLFRSFDGETDPQYVLYSETLILVYFVEEKHY